jgi:hypothetical protein
MTTRARRPSPPKASLALTSIAALTVAACTHDVGPRAQLLLVIDTDAHLASELSVRPDVSPDAAIDSLRIDLLDAANQVYASNVILVGDPSSWPVSFGLLPAADGGALARVRIRAFRAHFARPGQVNGAATLDPFTEVTIDRLVWTTLPSADVSRVEVTLRSDCFGIGPSFADPQTTCIDKAHPSGSPTDGVTPLTANLPPTHAGTWAPAIARPCVTSSDANRICIPGGYSVLGDYAAVGAPNTTSDQEPVPLHPAIVDAFLLDRDEFTVGRARALVLSGALDPSSISTSEPGAPLDQYCTWLGPNDPSNDDLPLNCLPYAAALAACTLSQGTLPTEAQWLHAARGRGDDRNFPWGNADPTCCALSVSRDAAFVSSPQCAGAGVEPVGSHPPDAACDGLGDVSKDAVLDLGGSVAEILLDDFQSYSAPCWGHGVVVDPVCTGGPDGGPHAAHGASWSMPLSAALLAPRAYADIGPDFGFRCAYPDGSP